MICPKCGASYEGETCPECSNAAQPEATAPTPESEQPVTETAAATPEAKQAAPEAAAPTPEAEQPAPEAAAPTPEPKQPEPVPEKTALDIVLIVLAVMGGLLLGIMAVMMLTDRMPEWAGSGSDAESGPVFQIPEFLEEQKAITTVQKDHFPPGEYVVGKDIPAGSYVAVSCNNDPGQFFYIGVYESHGKKKGYSDLIWEGYKQLHCHVKAEDGQTLVIEDAELYPHANYQKHPYTPYSDPGCYLIGTDLEPGRYQIIANNTSGVGSCIVYEGEIPDDRYATCYSYIYPDTPDCILDLKKGQCLELIDCVVEDYYD